MTKKISFKGIFSVTTVANGWEVSYATDRFAPETTYIAKDRRGVVKIIADILRGQK